MLFALVYILGQQYLPDLAKHLHNRFIIDNAGFIVQATSGVLAILTLIFQPDGLGTVTAPIGRWLKGEPFVFGSRGGAGAEGLSVRP